MPNQFSLLQERRFRPFFFSQLLGAFNDNVFKTVLISLVVFHGSELSSMDSGTVATLLPALFILPFLLFSATAGQIADKFEKSRLIRRIKLFEIGIMLVASLGFYWHSLGLLTGALFLLGLHSSLFGPVKYAYLPQHLTKDELIGGNGLVEMATFLAILLGQILGADLAVQAQYALLASLVTLSLALSGYWVSRNIPYSAAAAPDLTIHWQPLRATWQNLTFARQDKKIGLALLAISWFWFYGATLLAQFPSFAKHTLDGDESVFILLLAVFSSGVGLGSLLCEKLSKRKLEPSLTVLGALGLSLFGLDLYFASSGLPAMTALQNYTQFTASLENLRLLLDIALIGVFGGFYIVPLYAYIQSHAEESHRARIIASNNILNALFMIASGIASIALFKLGFTIPQLFLATALAHTWLMLVLCLYQAKYWTRFSHWIK